MEPEIIMKDAFNVIGYELRTTTNEGKNLREIPEFWSRYHENNRGALIPGKKYPAVVLGICCDFDRKTNLFSYVIGFENVGEADVPDGMVVKHLPALKYAVFTTPEVKMEEFTRSIQKTTGYIYSEWLPESGFEYNGEGVDIEVYDERCSPDREYVQMDVCVPVKYSLAEVLQ
ncbi:MAG: AraC family transcriptional regulator [Chitinispirillaceae bacterium]|nr:AraC family transcriptional regulator [Chitinispirillaceae bacterium]